MDSVEVDKLLDRPNHRAGGHVNVGLDDLILLTAARVGDVNRNRNFAARIVIAEQHVSQRVALLLAQ